MPVTELFLLALIIIYALPYLVWRLGRTDHWAPLVVVQIVGGILLGPGVLGTAIPELHAAVFTPQVIDARVAAIGWRRGTDWQSRVSVGAEHEENAWAARLPEIFGWLLARKP